MAEDGVRYLCFKYFLKSPVEIALNGFPVSILKAICLSLTHIRSSTEGNPPCSNADGLLLDFFYSHRNTGSPPNPSLLMSKPWLYVFFFIADHANVALILALLKIMVKFLFRLSPKIRHTSSIQRYCRVDPLLVASFFHRLSNVPLHKLLKNCATT